MCCGGTVPISVTLAASVRPNAWPASRLRSAKARQVLACATGAPVLPEVNTIAATRSSGTSGIAAVASPGGPTRMAAIGSVASESVMA